MDGYKVRHSTQGVKVLNPHRIFAILDLDIAGPREVSYSEKKYFKVKAKIEKRAYIILSVLRWIFIISNLGFMLLSASYLHINEYVNSNAASLLGVAIACLVILSYFITLDWLDFNFYTWKLKRNRKLWKLLNYWF